eukprot:9503982-Pyramimonas_sp.AAC.2
MQQRCLLLQGKSVLRPASTIDRFHGFRTVLFTKAPTKQSRPKSLPLNPHVAPAKSLRYLLVQAVLALGTFGDPKLYAREPLDEAWNEWERLFPGIKKPDDTTPLDNRRAAVLMAIMDDVCRFVAYVLSAPNFEMTNADLAFEDTHLLPLSVLDAAVSAGSATPTVDNDLEEKSGPQDISTVKGNDFNFAREIESEEEKLRMPVEGDEVSAARNRSKMCLYGFRISNVLRVFGLGFRV